MLPPCHVLLCDMQLKNLMLNRENIIWITFEETGEKIKMHLQQVGIPPEMYDECIKGWNQSFDKLEENNK